MNAYSKRRKWESFSCRRPTAAGPYLQAAKIFKKVPKRGSRSGAMENPLSIVEDGIFLEPSFVLRLTGRALPCGQLLNFVMAARVHCRAGRIAHALRWLWARQIEPNGRARPERDPHHFNSLVA